MKIKDLLCRRCKKQIRAHKKLVCNRCYEIIKWRSKESLASIKRLKDKIQKGLDNTSEYIDCFNALDEYHKELYELKQFVPMEISIIPPTYEEYRKDLKAELTKVLDERLQFIIYRLEKTGDILYVKQLSEFKDAINLFSNEMPWLLERYDIKEMIDTIKMYR